jgi:hypothetical protein
MLVLQADQLEALEQLDAQQFARALAPGLAELWPAVAGRLGERHAAFVAAGLAAARREGLTTPLLAAGLVNLWCVWGPGFETASGFEWARAILDARGRQPAVRMHQLAHATRELLQRAPASGAAAVASGATPVQFDAALVRLPALVEMAAQQGVFEPVIEALAQPAACDLAALELTIVNSDWRCEYRCGSDGLHWQAAAPEAASMVVDAPSAQALPIAALGPPTRASPSSNLRLRLQPLACCDPARHPAVVLMTPAGVLSRHGRDALALMQPLLGPAQANAALWPIAAEVEPASYRLAIETCGVRDAGEPVGPLTVEARVFPAVQHRLECQVPAGEVRVLPLRGEAAAAPMPACHVERDGAVADGQAWVAAWRALHKQLAEGLEKLLNTWARVGGIDEPCLEATLTALAGSSALTWGYREEGVSSAFMRLEGQLQLIACALDLTLSGQLSEGPARARVRLRAQGRSELQATLARLSSTTPLDAALASAQASWRFPLEVEIEPVASAEMSSLIFSGPPQGGALLGSAGLRPRAAGGCEWFFRLQVEAAAISVTRVDPVFGSMRRTRQMLPAMSLVEWSSG